MPIASSRPLFRVLLVSAVLGLGVALSGCTDARTGTIVGTGVGAAVGQAIGGDTESTVAGAVVGASVGYQLGKDAERRRQHEGSRDDTRHEW